MLKTQKHRQTRLKADERRNSLIRAALLLFTEKGFGATRMDEIAEAAGCTTGPLYHFFNTKSEIFEAVMARYIEVAARRNEKMRAGLQDQSPLNRLGAYIDGLLDLPQIATAQMFLREGPSLVGEQRFQALLDKLILRSVELDLRQAMVEGQINPEPPAPLAEIFMAATIMAIVRANPESPEALKLSRAAIQRTLDRLRC